VGAARVECKRHNHEGQLNTLGSEACVIEGVDVSKYQSGDYAWAKFYIVRLGYSLTEDYMAGRHIAFAKAHGIPHGGYWFIYNTATGAAQAQACFNVMTTLEIVGRPIFADAEGDANPNTVREFIDRMKRLNAHCGMYSGYWIKSHGGGTLGAAYGWLADYRSDWSWPINWPPAFRKLHQYTSFKDGIHLDRNYWRAPDAEFAAFWNVTEDPSSDEMAFTEFADGQDAFLAGKPISQDWSADKKRGWRTEKRIATAASLPVPGSPAPHTHNYSNTVSGTTDAA
jgi:hypothetical protein